MMTYTGLLTIDWPLPKQLAMLPRLVRGGPGLLAQFSSLGKGPQLELPAMSNNAMSARLHLSGYQGEGTNIG